MPLVIVESPSVTLGQTLDAIYADGNRRWPVQIRKISERTLLVEPADARDIVSTVVENATTSSGICPPNRQTIGDPVKFARVAKATELLRQLATTLSLLKADGNEPEELVTESVGTLFDYLAAQRDRARLLPRSKKDAA
jgi:hypothetical protein